MPPARRNRPATASRGRLPTVTSRIINVAEHYADSKSAIVAEIVARATAAGTPEIN